MNFFKALGEAFVETCQEFKEEAEQERKNLVAKGETRAPMRKLLLGAN